MWSLWTMEPSQSPPRCSTWGGMAEASTAAEERAEEERAGEALSRERARQEDDGSRRSVRGPAALHLPLLIASRGRRGRTWGETWDQLRPLPPRLAFITHKCEPKLPHGTCGRFRDAKDPRLGQGADVAGPLPAATSHHARGLAGFPATWLADGPWPARGPVHVPVGSRPPTPEEFD